MTNTYSESYLIRTESGAGPLYFKPTLDEARQLARDWVVTSPEPIVIEREGDTDDDAPTYVETVRA